MLRRQRTGFGCSTVSGLGLRREGPAGTRAARKSASIRKKKGHMTKRQDGVKASRGLRIRTCKITPLRISLFNQADLPFAVPFLQPFLSADRLVHIIEQLEVDEAVDVVAFGEALDHLVLVLPDSPRQVAGYANVYDSPGLAREDVDGGLLRHVG
jgi:hypothetical protein